MNKIIVNLYDDEDGIFESFLVTTSLSKRETEKLIGSLINKVKKEFSGEYTTEDLTDAIAKQGSLKIEKQTAVIKVYF